MPIREAEVVGKHDKPQFRVNVRAVLAVVVVLVAASWFLKGGPAYTVAPDEEGIVLTFGRFTKSTPPGLHFKWPWPIQTVVVPNVTEVKRVEVGFRSVTQGGKTTYRSFDQDPEMLKEARMLTGDENVVDASMVVQYYIQDALEYVFNFKPDVRGSMIRDMAEAGLRQAVGDHPIDDVLTDNKVQVEQEVQQKMQELADLVKMGVVIDQVKLQDVHPPDRVDQAFKRVASAREEREKFINEAQAYQREQMPKAEGEVERIQLEADAYRKARVAAAQGAVERFTAIAKEYENAPEVTRARLYLEAMEDLLPKVKVTVIDGDAGVVNLRNLGEKAGAAVVSRGQEKGGAQQ